MVIDYSPKPIKNGDWNGSGCHVNYSTLNMRKGFASKSGLDFINEAIEKLREKHDEHMDVYGEGNRDRMTGELETASYNEFTHGVADRTASVRIPQNRMCQPLLLLLQQVVHRYQIVAGQN